MDLQKPVATDHQNSRWFIEHVATSNTKRHVKCSVVGQDTEYTHVRFEDGTTCKLNKACDLLSIIPIEHCNSEDAQVCVSELTTKHERWLHACNSELQQYQANVTKLQFINEITVPYNLCCRFINNGVYTHFGPNLLVSINPCSVISTLYTTDVAERYTPTLVFNPDCFPSGSGRKTSVLTTVPLPRPLLLPLPLPPPLTIDDSNDSSPTQHHIYEIGQKALENVAALNRRQCIVLTGEAGSGKTEAMRQLLEYFSYMSGIAAMSTMQEIMTPVCIKQTILRNMSYTYLKHNTSFGGTAPYSALSLTTRLATRSIGDGSSSPPTSPRSPRHTTADVSSPPMSPRSPRIGGSSTAAAAAAAADSTNVPPRNLTPRLTISQNISGDAAGKLLINDRILRAASVLEAFGNATTRTNHNSSRFIKFLQLYFDRIADGSAMILCGAKIQISHIEYDRVVHVASLERVFHIFYQLIYSEDHEMADHARRGLCKQVEQFSYLQRSGCYYIHIDKSSSSTNNLAQSMDYDKRDFKALCNHISVLGIKSQEISTVFDIIALILHIGNVQFKSTPSSGSGSSSSITIDKTGMSETACTFIPRLSGVDMRRFEQTFFSSSRFTVAATTIEDAIIARDALAATIYGRLFAWLVDRINRTLVMPRQQYLTNAVISILDTIGFAHIDSETDSLCSLATLCANYSAERFNQCAIDVLLTTKQQEYIANAVSWKPIKHQDHIATLNSIDSCSTCSISNCLASVTVDGAPNSMNTKILREMDLRARLSNVPGLTVNTAATLNVNHYPGIVVRYSTDDLLDHNNIFTTAEHTALLDGVSLSSGTTSSTSSLCTFSSVMKEAGVLLHEYQQQLLQLLLPSNSSAATAPTSITSNKHKDNAFYATDTSKGIFLFNDVMALSPIGGPHYICERSVPSALSLPTAYCIGSSNSNNAMHSSILTSMMSSPTLVRKKHIVNETTLSSPAAVPPAVASSSSAAAVAPLSNQEVICRSRLTQVCFELDAFITHTLSDYSLLFVHCVKPNDSRIGTSAISKRVLQQLNQVAAIEYARSVVIGWPISYDFRTFIERYSVLSGRKHHYIRNNTNAQTYVEHIMFTLPSTSKNSYTVALDKIYMRQTTQTLLDMRLYECYSRNAVIVQKLYRGYTERKRIASILTHVAAAASKSKDVAANASKSKDVAANASKSKDVAAATLPNPIDKVSSTLDILLVENSNLKDTIYTLRTENSTLITELDRINKLSAALLIQHEKYSNTVAQLQNENSRISFILENAEAALEAEERTSSEQLFEYSANMRKVKDAFAQLQDIVGDYEQKVASREQTIESFVQAEKTLREEVNDLNEIVLQHYSTEIELMKHLSTRFDSTIHRPDQAMFVLCTALISTAFSRYEDFIGRGTSATAAILSSSSSGDNKAAAPGSSSSEIQSSLIIHTIRNNPDCCHVNACIYPGAGILLANIVELISSEDLDLFIKEMCGTLLVSTDQKQESSIKIKCYAIQCAIFVNTVMRARLVELTSATNNAKTITPRIVHYNNLVECLNKHICIALHNICKILCALLWTTAVSNLLGANNIGDRSTVSSNGLPNPQECSLLVEKLEEVKHMLLHQVYMPGYIAAQIFSTLAIHLDVRCFNFMIGRTDVHSYNHAITMRVNLTKIHTWFVSAISPMYNVCRTSYHLSVVGTNTTESSLNSSSSSNIPPLSSTYQLRHTMPHCCDLVSLLFCSIKDILSSDAEVRNICPSLFNMQIHFVLMCYKQNDALAERVISKSTLTHFEHLSSAGTCKKVAFPPIEESVFSLRQAYHIALAEYRVIPKLHNWLEWYGCNDSVCSPTIQRRESIRFIVI